VKEHVLRNKIASANSTDTKYLLWLHFSMNPAYVNPRIQCIFGDAGLENFLGTRILSEAPEPVSILLTIKWGREVLAYKKCLSGGGCAR